MRLLMLGWVAAVGLLAGSSFGVINFKLMAIDPETGQEMTTTAIRPGTQLTIALYAQGTNSGVLAVGGNIVASGTPGVLDSSGEHFAWKVEYYTERLWTPANNPTTQNGAPVQVCDASKSFAVGIAHPNYTYANGKPVALNGYTYPARPTSVVVAGQVAPTADGWYKGGIAGANGGMSELGSMQSTFDQYSRDFAKDRYELLGSYNARVVGSGSVSLAWEEAPLANGIHVGYGGFYTVGGDIGDWHIGMSTPATIGTVTPLMLSVVPEPATMALLTLGGLLVARRRSV